MNGSSARRAGRVGRPATGKDRRVLAFGKEPPRSASLAVMSDSDNTGEKGVSFIDWIEIARPPGTEP